MFLKRKLNKNVYFKLESYFKKQHINIERGWVVFINFEFIKTKLRLYVAILMITIKHYSCYILYFAFLNLLKVQQFQLWLVLDS